MEKNPLFPQALPRGVRQCALLTPFALPRVGLPRCSSSTRMGQEPAGREVRQREPRLRHLTET